MSNVDLLAMNPTGYRLNLLNTHPCSDTPGAVGNQSCLPCPAGNSSRAGSTSCNECGLGTYRTWTTVYSNATGCQQARDAAYNANCSVGLNDTQVCLNATVSSRDCIEVCLPFISCPCSKCAFMTRVLLLSSIF